MTLQLLLALSALSKGLFYRLNPLDATAFLAFRPAED